VPVEGVRQRLITALLAVIPLIGVVFLLPRTYGAVLLALMALGGAWEWAGFFQTVSNARRAAYVVLIGIGLGVVWVTAFDFVLPVSWVAMGWWLIAFIWLLRFPTPVPTWLVLIGGMFVLIPGWLALAALHIVRGPQWLAFFFVLIAAADSGAYFAGKGIGQTRLAPNVSPGKTWEGAGGGLVFGSGIAALGAVWFGVPLVFLVSLSLAVCLLSIVGDLTISMFKRNAGLKDSGGLFPGHGGVLDRIDSISAGAPLFVIGLGWSQHIT